ncbi:anomalous homeobox protein [Onychomys torridus]|uniref:anomalous homeobox protein n=1 Tax=Onychomys torridus TaxID=38674 RepID=UPI00167F3236|nr:anomalous homeobox protein [Onychomys torridus]
MENFLRLLREHGDAPPPPPELVTLAGKLCQDFQHNPGQVLRLVKAILDSQHRWDLLNNADVALVCTRVLIHQERRLLALQILQGCRVPGGSQELVRLWNDIHYHLTMRRLCVTKLSPGQKFRCRKRNPPPSTLCPEGPKNRNFLPEVRCHLQDFATGVGAYPKKAQLEELASETGLTPEQVYNWFANYRRRQKALLLHLQRAQEAKSEVSSAKESGSEPLQLSGYLHESVAVSQWSARSEGSGTLQPSETPQGSQGPQPQAVSFSGDNTTSQAQAFRSLYGCERYQEWPGHHPASLTSMGFVSGLCPLATGSSMLDSSMAAHDSWMMPFTLSSSEEHFLSMEQPGLRQQLDSGMDPEPLPLAMDIAALTGPSHAGSTGLCGIRPRSLYPEQSPGPRSGQAASTAGCKIHHPHGSLEVMSASSGMPAPVSVTEQNQHVPSSQVQWSGGQASWNAFSRATMLLELSEGSMGQTARVEIGSARGMSKCGLQTCPTPVSETHPE